MTGELRFPNNCVKQLRMHIGGDQPKPNGGLAGYVLGIGRWVAPSGAHVTAISCGRVGGHCREQAWIWICKLSVDCVAESTLPCLLYLERGGSVTIDIFFLLFSLLVETAVRDGSLYSAYSRNQPAALNPVPGRLMTFVLRHLCLHTVQLEAEA